MKTMEKEHVAHGRPTLINWGVSYTFSIRWTEKFPIAGEWKVFSRTCGVQHMQHSADTDIPQIQIQIHFAGPGGQIDYFLPLPFWGESGKLGERCSRNRLIENWPLGRAFPPASECIREIHSCALALRSLCILKTMQQPLHTFTCQSFLRKAWLAPDFFATLLWPKVHSVSDCGIFQACEKIPQRSKNFHSNFGHCFKVSIKPRGQRKNFSFLSQVSASPKVCYC